MKGSSYCFFHKSTARPEEGHEHLRDNSRSLGGEFNPGRSKYEAGVVITQPRCSAIYAIRPIRDLNRLVDVTYFRDTSYQH
jgi:hypothetical protein